MQPYTDTPLDFESVGENVYMNMINRAKEYVYISTPYLIIDNEMITALCNAAKSGVEIILTTPKESDSKIVSTLTHSYYKPLVSCGVKIYEYQDGIIPVSYTHLRLKACLYARLSAISLRRFSDRDVLKKGRQKIRTAQAVLCL